MQGWRDLAREMVATLDLHAMTWRHHGLGMMQAEITDRLRVHLWHPKLRRMSTENFRDVHDHRFTLTSAVIVGEIIDVPYFVVPVEEAARASIGGVPIVGGRYPTATMFEIVHAKEQDKLDGRGCSAPTVGKAIGEAYVVEQEARRFAAGSVYMIKRRDFHTTRLNPRVLEGLAITLVHRCDFDQESKLARVLGQANETMLSGIVRDDINSSVTQAFVLKEAAYAIAELQRA